MQRARTSEKPSPFAKLPSSSTYGRVTSRRQLLRVDVELRPDRAEHVADPAACEGEAADRDESDERDDQGVLDESLTLFVAKAEPGPHVSEQHICLLEHMFLLLGV